MEELPELPSPTRRFEVLRHLGIISGRLDGTSWHRYGDQNYDRWSWMHLPSALYDGVGEATIQWSEDSPQPLVDKTCVLMMIGHPPLLRINRIHVRHWNMCWWLYN